MTSDKIIQAFRSLGSISAPIKDVITEKLIQKCQQMCQDHDLSPTDLAYKWEAYIDKACDDTSILLDVPALALCVRNCAPEKRN